MLFGTQFYLKTYETLVYMRIETIDRLCLILFEISHYIQYNTVRVQESGITFEQNLFCKMTVKIEVRTASTVTNYSWQNAR